MNWVGAGGPPLPRLPGSYAPNHISSGLPPIQLENPLPNRGQHYRTAADHWVMPPMMLMTGVFGLALAYLQPHLKSPADDKDAMYYQGLFALLLMFWSYVANWRGRMRTASRRAAFGATWTDTGEDDGLPKKDWTAATAPPDGYALLQTAEGPLWTPHVHTHAWATPSLRLPARALAGAPSPSTWWHAPGRAPLGDGRELMREPRPAEGVGSSRRRDSVAVGEEGNG